MNNINSRRESEGTLIGGELESNEFTIRQMRQSNTFSTSFNQTYLEKQTTPSPASEKNNTAGAEKQTTRRSIVESTQAKAKERNRDLLILETSHVTGEEFMIKDQEGSDNADRSLSSKAD